MNRVEKILLVLLVAGVWALVLKPDSPSAHAGTHHACTFSWGGGSGEVTGRNISINDTDPSVSCSHFWSSDSRPH